MNHKPTSPFIETDQFRPGEYEKVYTYKVDLKTKKLVAINKSEMIAIMRRESGI
jgi:hypothetical protein